MKLGRVLGVAALALNLDAGRACTGDQSSCEHDLTVYVDGAGRLFTKQTRIWADRILATAGVRVKWKLGRPTLDRGDRLVIGVAFLGAASMAATSDRLAHSYPFDINERRIAVSHSHIRGMAEAAALDVFKLTANVLAHEIVHILQGLNRHSDTGLMKARWTHAEYRAIDRNPLPLTPEDIALIRQGLERVRCAAKAGAR